MRALLIALSLLITAGIIHAEIVRLAPDFTFPSIGNKAQSLKGLRGQPVVLLIGKSPKSKEIKLQAKSLRTIYQEFANKQVIFIAAFTGDSGPVASDIPFVIANNGPAVASAYGMQATTQGKEPIWRRVLPGGSGGPGDFNIVIIGKDGNVDYQTDKVLTPERVRDVIQNSYAVQANTGR